MFERLVNRLIEPQRAEQRIATQPRDNLGLSGEDAGLRAAEQFIAAEGHQIGAGAQAIGDERLVDAERAQIGQAAAAEILINRHAALAAERCEFAQRRGAR